MYVTYKEDPKKCIETIIKVTKMKTTNFERKTILQLVNFQIII